MMRKTFCRYHLRTTDVDAARVFYRDALGFNFAGRRDIGIWPLHEQARARGAPAHWLGFISVENLASTVEKLLGSGAQLLGPPMLRGEDGEPFAILRDPCEAVVGLREVAENSSNDDAPSAVRWHQLHTRDRDRSWTLYSELFGWEASGDDVSIEAPTIGNPAGGYRMFRWSSGSETNVGVIANTARLPGVHAHWLYYFPVPNLESALANVKSYGGVALPSIALPNGDRLAACEDPQKAAFGLVQIARS